MTVEEIRGDNEIDRFPIGMRVLAVDDDPTCLKLLEGLLRKCKYQVTTTSQAITALKMLRENRNRFDLVISDVHMPDMDGFKLLELVGLEMDLPVIMLSGNSDPKLVMKGVTHGACDYLVKPVRLEELRNIWQHVLRRKVESKSQSKSNNKANQGSEGAQEDGSGDQNGKNRKRKDEEEDVEENGHDDDDPSSQKKPRVVWSIDLHRKFVAAVNQLGIEKAVPKRILDLMNVEGLTRENVASHLQKYRLYLKRISQQANMVVAFGGNKDASSYMRMSSLDGLSDYRTLSGSGRLPNASLSSYLPSGMLSRLNSATGMTLQSLTSPSLIQPSHAKSMTSSISSLNKFQPVVLPTTTPSHQSTNLFQGIPNTRLSDFSPIDESKILMGSSSLSALGNQSSLKMASTSLDSFNLVSSGSSFLDPIQIQSPKFPSNPLPMGETFHESYGYSATCNSGFGANITTTASVPIDVQSDGLVGDVIRNVNPSSSNQSQKHGQYGKQDYTHCSNNAFGMLAALGSANGGGFGGPMAKDQICEVYNRSDGGGSTLLQPNRETEKSSVGTSEDYLMEQTKLQTGFMANNGYDSLDDLMNGMMKREQDPGIKMDGEFGFDPYSFGSCI